MVVRPQAIRMERLLLQYKPILMQDLVLLLRQVHGIHATIGHGLGVAPNVVIVKKE